MKRLRIAYLSDVHPDEVSAYSGGNTRIRAALQRHAGEVTVLSPGWHAAEPLRRLVLALPETAALRVRWRAQLALAAVIAAGIRDELARARYDVLFGAYAFQCLDRLRAPYPLVTAYTTDAVPTVYRTSRVGGAFERKLPGGAALDPWIERREAAVLRRADLLLWSSRWLKTAADARYGLAPERSHTVPWGANIAAPPSPSVRPMTAGRPVRLLLVGRDWFAKGGPLAFATQEVLRSRGIDARLTVIGCVPPDVHRNAHVTVHPHLDKTVPSEAATFAAAYAGAHFLVQPSYESYGFAFCEASAHGLPSLCLDVGGVPVFDGVNGYALPADSDAVAFADVVAAHVADPDRYVALCQSARHAYETTLNWDAWGRRTAALLSAAVERRAA